MRRGPETSCKCGLADFIKIASVPSVRMRPSLYGLEKALTEDYT
jgi:hypothetical protein